jgi:hypothetical protein
MLMRVLLMVLLFIWTNSGSADCLYNGVLYPYGTTIPAPNGYYACANPLTTSVKNWLWLLFGSGFAVGAAGFLFRGARRSSNRRIFSITLYGAAVLLCMEVFVTFIRFFTRS